MLVQNPFAVEIPPLFHQEKSLLDHPLSTSLGPVFLIHLGRIGKYLIRQFRLTLERNVIYMIPLFTLADEGGEVHAMKGILVE